MCGWVSSPISPPGGIVMVTSWLLSPVQSTRRKSVLCSATLAIGNFRIIAAASPS